MEDLVDSPNGKICTHIHLHFFMFHCRAPYLLFATWNGIYRISPNGSDMQLLVQEQAGGIVAIDYHYRFAYICWYSNSA